MTDRFLLYVGHFDHNDKFASIHTDDRTTMAYPKVNKPLCEGVTLASAINFCGGDANRVSNWDVRVENGHIVFCELIDAKALEWVRELFRTESMDVIEGGTMRVVPISEIDSLVASLT